MLWLHNNKEISNILLDLLVLNDIHASHPATRIAYQNYRKTAQATAAAYGARMAET